MQHQDDAPLAFWSQSSQLYDENSDPSGENQPSSSNANQESDPPVPLESVRTKLEERRGVNYDFRDKKPFLTKVFY